MQTRLSHVGKIRFTVSIKGDPGSIRDLFFTNSLERQGTILYEGMDNMGPVRLKDVDAVQSEVVSTSKDLEDAGEVLPVDGSSKDEFVYWLKLQSFLIEQALEPFEARYRNTL